MVRALISQLWIRRGCGMRHMCPPRSPRPPVTCPRVVCPGRLIDPTTDEGAVPDELSRWPLPSIPTTLARINEPPPGSDVNTGTDERGNEVEFFASIDIEQGDELFIDYGTLYNRGDYGGPDL